MGFLSKLIEDGKVYYATLEKHFNAIPSTAVKLAVAGLSALALLAFVWAILPWIGFVFAAAVIAVIVKSLWPANDRNGN